MFTLPQIDSREKNIHRNLPLLTSFQIEANQMPNKDTIMIITGYKLAIIVLPPLKVETKIENFPPP